MKNQTVRIMTPGQMKEIISAMVEGVPAGMAFETARSWVGNKGKLTAQVRKIFSATNPYVELLADWQAFYRCVFEVEVDFSNLVIPEKRAGFDRLLIVAQGMTPQCLYNKCGKLFSVRKWSDENLDKIVISDRTVKDGAYAVWVRDRVEADEELKNRSYNDLKQQGITGITLEERQIYELKFFNENGEHLDIANWTLCAGSRYSAGGVPGASWSDGKFRVGWGGPGDAGGRLRSRQVVS